MARNLLTIAGFFAFVGGGIAIGNIFGMVWLVAVVGAIHLWRYDRRLTALERADDRQTIDSAELSVLCDRLDRRLTQVEKGITAPSP